MLILYIYKFSLSAIVSHAMKRWGRQVDALYMYINIHAPSWFSDHHLIYYHMLQKVSEGPVRLVTEMCLDTKKCRTLWGRA